jgi:predicted dehydrogenase
VGCGWWSTSVHLPALVARDDVTLVGVCDLDLQKAEIAARRFGAGIATADVSELMAQTPDAVVVATAQDAHVAPALAAVGVGADVLVEKPMALNVLEAQSLVESARAAGVRLHVGYPFLYTRHVRRVRRAVEDGELGTVSFASGLFATQMREHFSPKTSATLSPTLGGLFAPEPSTYSDPRRGGGQVTSQMTHAIGVLLHVLGDTVVEVVGVTDDGQFDVDVNAAGVFTTDRGATVAVSSTGLVVAQRQRVEEYRFFGEAGHALLDTVAGTLRFLGGSPWEEAPLDASEIYPSAEPVNRLVDARKGEAEVVASGELGLEVTKVVEALLRKRSSLT